MPRASEIQLFSGLQAGIGQQIKQEEGTSHNFQTSSACSGPIWSLVQGNHVYLGQPWE